MTDTIYAQATAPGKAGVSVIRLSGPSALAAATALGATDLPPRRAVLRTLTHDGTPLDHALALAFPAPGSFTGEDTVELHLHGSRAIVAATLAALSAQPGLRPADPGEFTRRALENDRLDLAEVEGLADLIEAETAAQHRQAMRVFSGALGAKAEAWRSDLIRAAALLEATIDFADEEVPVDVTPEVTTLLDSVTQDLQKEIAGAAAAERIRDGFEVAIVGPPNAGKSTLLNRLAGRDAAITSEVAGTTRDVIEVHMDLGGLPVTILDTAGLRDSDDSVESIGIDRARTRAAAADLRILLVPTGGSPALPAKPGDIVVTAKDDEGTRSGVSGKTGAGIDRLIRRVTDTLTTETATAGVAIRERHRVAMERAVGALGIARDRLQTSPDQAELVADDLRTAIRALSSLVGRVDVEHLLGEIFASFCIGK